ANTYGGYLANRQNPGWRANMTTHLEQITNRMLSLGLLELEGDLVRLTMLGRACGQSSLSLQSAMRLVEILKTSGLQQITAEILMVLVQVLPEADSTYTPMFKRGNKESEMPRKAAGRVGNNVIGQLQRFIDGDQFQYYGRCKRAAILFDWIGGSPVERIEADYTMNPYSGKVGFGDIQRIAEATKYHFRTAAPIAELILIEKGPSGQGVETLLAQLEFGIPADSLDLLKLKIRFERGEYLALCNAGIKDCKVFWSAAPEVLSGIFGKDRLAAIEKNRDKVNA
ncbi:MAG: DEAD/DEAH box helicase, partial [Candidatus Omnitrophica bacterium]|nr:DEAD/DEAH box helicase [Candidatus Omnitrophota bacterium]